MKIGAVEDIEFKPGKGTFYWGRCQKCGEVVFSHGLRVVRKHYCTPCLAIVK